MKNKYNIGDKVWVAADSYIKPHCMIITNITLDLDSNICLYQGYNDDKQLYPFAVKESRCFYTPIEATQYMYRRVIEKAKSKHAELLIQLEELEDKIAVYEEKLNKILTEKEYGEYI